MKRSIGCHVKTLTLVLEVGQYIKPYLSSSLKMGIIIIIIIFLFPQLIKSGQCMYTFFVFQDYYSQTLNITDTAPLGPEKVSALMGCPLTQTLLLIISSRARTNFKTFYETITPSSVP